MIRDHALVARTPVLVQGRIQPQRIFPVAGFTEARPRRGLPLQTLWPYSLIPKCPPKNSREWSPVSATLCTFPTVANRQIRAPELPCRG